MAKWEDVNKNWSAHMGKAKERWGKFSDQEIKDMGGDRERIVDNLVNRYGHSRAEAESEADAFADALVLSSIQPS